MKLYRVASNITTKLLGCLWPNVEALDEVTIEIISPGSATVIWVNVPRIEGSGRFEAEYTDCLNGYALALADGTAEPARQCIDECFTKDEADLLSTYLRELKCRVVVTEQNLPMPVEEARPLIADPPNNIGFAVYLPNDNLFEAVGVVLSEGFHVRGKTAAELVEDSRQE